MTELEDAEQENIDNQDELPSTGNATVNIVGLLTAMGMAVLGFFGYRRTRK